jgi:hypothetical protein
VFPPHGALSPQGTKNAPSLAVIRNDVDAYRLKPSRVWNAASSTLSMIPSPL